MLEFLRNFIKKLPPFLCPPANTEIKIELLNQSFFKHPRNSSSVFVCHAETDRIMFSFLSEGESRRNILSQAECCWLCK